MTVTSLSREDQGRIINKFDRAQRLLDETHSTALAVCRGVRGPSANGLLVELDRFAEQCARHRREVGRLLDELREKP